MHRERNGSSGHNGNGSSGGNGDGAGTLNGTAGVALVSPSENGAENTLTRSTLTQRSARVEQIAVPQDELEFREIVAALKRRNHILLTFAVLGMLCGLTLAFVSKKKFSATATLEFAQPSTRALGLQDSTYSESDLSTLELLNTELKTQEAEITDDGTALAVLQKLHLDTQAPFAIPATLSSSDPLVRERGLPLSEAPFQRERVIKLLQRQLTVDVVKGTRLLNVTYSDSNPERAAAVANAVVAASIDQNAGRRFQAFSQVSTWLTDQLTALRQRVEDSQRNAEEYENANQTELAGMTISPLAGTAQEERSAVSGASESVPVSRLLTLNNELTGAQVARISREAIYRVAQTGDPEAVLSIGSSALVVGQGADSSLAPGNGGLALLQHLREQQVQTNVQIAAEGTRYGAKSQTMVELRRQQAEIDTQMRNELDRIRERAHSDLVLATRAEDGLRQQVTNQQGEVSQWTSKADHLLLLQGEAASSRALYQDLYAKLQESQLAAGIRASRVLVLDPARVPTSPTSPRKTFDLGAGLIIGAFLGFVVAFGVELLDGSLHSEHDVRKALNAPILVSIPRFRMAKELQAWVVEQPRSQVAEAYRSFRARAFGNPRGDHGRVLLVASARPAEGKATVCLNTAAALALQGHSVLILNADMRRETAADPFGMSHATGLSTYLMGRSPLQEALIHPVQGMTNLSLLPAGPAPANASELLCSQRFRELMQQLRTRFEYVLVDTPPALLFADARLLSPYADEYVLVVKASRTLKDDLCRAADTLQGSGAAFLGIVMNGTAARKPAYGKFGYGV